MALYQAIAGQRVTATRWNTFYNLLKGVSGAEDTVRLANKAVDTFLLRPTTDPTSDVALMGVALADDTRRMGIWSHGGVSVGDQVDPGQGILSTTLGLIVKGGTASFSALGVAGLNLTSLKVAGTASFDILAVNNMRAGGTASFDTIYARQVFGAGTASFSSLDLSGTLTVDGLSTLASVTVPSGTMSGSVLGLSGAATIGGLLTGRAGLNISGAAASLSNVQATLLSIPQATLTTDVLDVQGASANQFLKITGSRPIWEALPTASPTAAGISELATAAEIDTGTATGRTMTPDAFAEAKRGEVEVQIPCFGTGTDTATGDSKAEFTISDRLAGMNIKRVFAFVTTAGVTGTLNVQISNVTQAADILSTVITIDSGELHTATAATPAVINGSEDDLTEHDIIAIDVDAIHSGTAAKGLVVGLICGTP